MDPPVRHMNNKVTDFAQLGRAIDSFKDMTKNGMLDSLFNTKNNLLQK